jgi:hypothetical protein
LVESGACRDSGVGTGNRSLVALAVLRGVHICGALIVVAALRIHCNEQCKKEGS